MNKLKVVISDCHIGSTGIGCFHIPDYHFIPENLCKSANESINNLLFFEEIIELIEE